MIEIDNIYNEDCLVGMQRIPDGSVDCIISDLPYGSTACSWDSVIPFEPLWEQFKRVTKPNAAIVLFGSEPFSSYLRISNIKWYRYDLIWDKQKGTGFANANKMPMKSHENISVFYQHLPSYNPQMGIGSPYIRKGRVRKSGSRIFSTRELTDDEKQNPSVITNKSSIASVVSKEKSSNGERYPLSVIYYSNANHFEVLHPTQKPVDLLRYLILTYSNPNDLILDATIGSGTTAVAALMEKRHFIGFELNKEYYDKAVRRIAEIRRNPTLDFNSQNSYN